MSELLVVIHQPDFIPYLGFFHRLLHADLYVVLEHVQFVRATKASWTARDQIKTSQGARWLTLPVQKAPLGTPICEILLKNDTNWSAQHLEIIRQNYHKAPFFEDLFPDLQKLYKDPPPLLWTFNLRSIELLASLLDVKRPMLFSGEMNPQGKSNNLVADLVLKAGSHRYLSGVGAKAYYDPTVFEEKKIKVEWQHFIHPVYPQQFGDFVPYLSTIDTLMNCGINETRRILREECG